MLAPPRPGARWPLVSTVLRTLRATARLLASRAGISVLIMLALAACIVALLGLGGPFAAFLILFTPVASILILVAINSLTSLAVLAGEAREAVRAGWIEAGRCPTCGYDLQDVRIDSDGCRVCPECGGAWRANNRPETVVVSG
jgi:predicted Zn-ribbon and HTH transcriptional regulator